MTLYVVALFVGIRLHRSLLPRTTNIMLVPFWRNHGILLSTKTVVGSRAFEKQADNLISEQFPQMTVSLLFKAHERTNDVPGGL